MSHDQQQYRLRWPIAQVRYARPRTAHGRLWGGETVMQGQLLPPDVDPEHLAHLRRMGMVEPVDPTPAPGKPATA